MALYRAEEEESESNGEKAREQLPDLPEGARLKLHAWNPNSISPSPRRVFRKRPGEGARRERDRASEHLCRHPFHHPRQGIRGDAAGYFRPSELGFIVNDLLVMSFPDVFDVEFTARMEENLDRVESEKANSLDILTSSTNRSERISTRRPRKMVSIKGVGVETGLKCPECGHTLHIKIGKNGHFLACSGYPTCKYSSDYTRDEKGQVHPVVPPADEATDKVCAKCGKPMVLKRGPFGDFLACSGFPECKNTQSLSVNGSAKSIRRQMPPGRLQRDLLEKTSKRGKVFYGCNRYPGLQLRHMGQAGSARLPGLRRQILSGAHHQKARHPAILSEPGLRLQRSDRINVSALKRFSRFKKSSFFFKCASDSNAGNAPNTTNTENA